MKCINCNTKYEGKFCNHCGQKSSVKRINYLYILTELSNNILQLDKGFFYTVKELVLRPGHSIRDFLAGKRVQHFKPLGFLLICSTIYVLTAYLLDRNTYYFDFATGFVEGGGDINDKSIIEWVSKYQVYFPLIILPIFSLASYLAFIKFKYNYFEHLVINFYITGQQMIFYWITGWFFYKENIWMITPILLGIVYNFWTFTQIFTHRKQLIKIALTLFTYFLFILILLIMIILLVGILKMLD